MGSGRRPKKGHDDGNLSEEDGNLNENDGNLKAVEGKPMYFESKSAGPAED
ncbi:hypothetical protein MKX03_012693, partial [Papaver bracteatum]